MKYHIYHVDAFTDRIGGGNPAAVICVDGTFLDDRTMQLIAMENSLSETAFVAREGGNYSIRWFTPVQEIDLCGHATLAAAYVLKRYMGYSDDSVSFESASGILKMRFLDQKIEMEFPARPPRSCPVPDMLSKSIGVPFVEVLKARDYLVILDNETLVRDLRPDIEKFKLPDCLGVIVSAPGDKADFVSRFFAPNAGIPEDPVTGSSHCTLVPYWAARLGKKKFSAEQVSRRHGLLECEYRGDTVSIAGTAVTYLIGEIYV